MIYCHVLFGAVIWPLIPYRNRKSFTCLNFQPLFSPHGFPKSPDATKFPKKYSFPILLTPTVPGRRRWCTCPETRCSSAFRPAPWAPAPPEPQMPGPGTSGRRGCRGRCPRAATRGTGPGSARRRALSTAEHGSLRPPGGSPAALWEM